MLSVETGVLAIVSSKSSGEVRSVFPLPQDGSRSIERKRKIGKSFFIIVAFPVKIILCKYYIIDLVKLQDLH